MKLSAVIACYRDAPAVPIMHERLVETFTEIGAEYEIISSTTGRRTTPGRCWPSSRRATRNVVVINHARAFGSQSAFTSGMQIATGDGWCCSTGTSRTRRS